MNVTKKMIALSLIVLSGCLAQQKESTVNNIYSIEVAKMDGSSTALGAYQGKVILLVNTASKCGFTGQFEGLQKLYETYQDQGFMILGFPSNDFMGQDPGSNEEIQSFCKLNYGVTFPMFAKLKVKGNEQHPLYTFLTSKQTNPEFGGKISWNFNKFLISSEGEIIGRFGSRVKPQSDDMVSAIEKALKESDSK